MSRLTLFEPVATWVLDAVGDAAEEMGVKRIPDFNTGDNEGCGYFQVNQRKGVRLSTATAFLKPVKSRANLKVFTHAEAENLLLEDGRAVPPAEAGVQIAVLSDG